MKRRFFLRGLILAPVAPVIVRASSLMNITPVFTGVAPALPLDHDYGVREGGIRYMLDYDIMKDIHILRADSIIRGRQVFVELMTNKESVKNKLALREKKVFLREKLMEAA